MFKNWFKPKWQNTNPDKRLIAISQLSPANPESTAILKELAEKDPALQVRIAAIKKIPDLNDLKKLLPTILNASREADKANIFSHLVTIFSADESQLAQKIELLQSIKDPGLASALIESNAALELLLTGLGQITSPDQLQHICLNHRLARVRITAAERIQSYQHLLEISQQTKGKDKAIYRVAKNKLDGLKDSVESAAREREACEQLLQQFEALTQANNDPLLYQKLNHLNKLWENTNSPEKAAFASQIKSATTKVNQLLAAQQSADITKTDAKFNIADALAEQKETCSTLEESLVFIQQLDSPLETDIPSLKAVLNTQKIRWEAATEHKAAPENLYQSYTRLCNLLSSFIRQASYLNNNQSRIATLIESAKELDHKNPAALIANNEKISAIQTEINWPDGISPPRLIKDLKSVSANQKKQLKALNQLIKNIETEVFQLIDELHQSLDQGKFKAAEHVAQKIKHLIKKLPTQHQQNAQKAFKPYANQLSEMKDWQGYATKPKKLELCEKMELLADTKLAPQEKSKKIQELQKEWKSLALLEKKEEQELWKRFSTAADKAFKPCKEHFQAQSEKRQANLLSRTQICSQLESYIQHYDWGKADWSAVVEVIKLAKAEWRQYSPVDRSAAKKIQATFDQHIESIQRKIDQHQTANLQRKKKLLDEVRQLHEEEDVLNAVEKVKQHRSSWSSIGMVPKSEFKSLQTAFDQACDEIFKRRQKLWDDTSAQKKYNAEQINLAVKHVKSLLETDSIQILRQRSELSVLEQAFQDHQPLEKHRYKALRNEIDSISKLFLKKVTQAEHKKFEGRLENLWEKSLLCRKLENWVLQGEASNDNLQQLKSDWNSLDDIPENAATALNLRFDAAIEAFSNQQAEQLSVNQNKRLSIIRELTIEMEILAGIESPTEDNDLRMKLQVNRLNKSISKKSNEIEQNRQRIQTEWCTTGPIEASLLSPYEKRFILAKSRIQKRQATPANSLECNET